MPSCFCHVDKPVKRIPLRFVRRGPYAVHSKLRAESNADDREVVNTAGSIVCASACNVRTQCTTYHKVLLHRNACNKTPGIKERLISREHRQKTGSPTYDRHLWERGKAYDGVSPAVKKQRAFLTGV